MKYTALLFAGLLSLAACSKSGPQKETGQAAVPVTAAKAVAQDIPVILKAVGRAEAFESVSLKARVDGQVASVEFTEGQHVNRGDVLIRLDPTDFAARLQQAEATVARDEALVARMRADTARYVALKDRNFVSEEKVNEVRTNEAAAVANLRASKAAAEVARLQLSYATLRAPITGIVGARLVFPGSAVKANDIVVAVVNRVRPLLVSFSVPERHLPQLRAARQAGSLSVDVSPPGDSSQHFTGSIRFIDNAVDAGTGTILLKAELPNQDEKLTPGQFLNVALLLDTLRQAVTVPDSAVQQGVENKFVYVVNGDSSVELREVEAVASADGFTAILGRVEPGETVITDGHLRLVPGARVKIKEAEPGSGRNEQAAVTDSSPRGG